MIDLDAAVKFAITASPVLAGIGATLSGLRPLSSRYAGGGMTRA